MSISLSKTVSYWLRLVTSLLLLGLAVQVFVGVGFQRRLKLDAKKMQAFSSAAPLVARWQMPEEMAGQAVALAQAEVLEDGKPLGLRFSSRKRLQDFSGPGYSVDAKAVLLRTSDGSLPQKNGRRYELQVPRTPHWTWLLVPVGVLAWLARDKTRFELPSLGLHRVPRWVWPVAVFLVVAALRLVAISRQPTYNDQLFSIAGVPNSDSAAWLELGISLADGYGYTGAFDSQRPVYSFLLGAVFLLTGGVSLLKAKLVNVLAHAAVVTLLTSLGWRSGRLGLGLFAAAVVAFSPAHQSMSHVLLTEQTGLALSLLALGLLWPAGGGWDGGSRYLLWGRLALAGVFFALGILSGPVALPAVPLLCFWVAFRFGNRRAVWWKRVNLVAGGFFGVGVLLVLLPWMMRQLKTQGVFTLSLQTADLLYTTASDAGKFDTTYGKELLDAGIDPADGFTAERYKFGMKRFKEAVAANPTRYLQRLGDSLVKFLEFREVRPPPVVGVFGVALLAMGLASLWKTGSLVKWLVTVALCWGLMRLVESQTLAITLPGAFAVLWWRAKQLRWALGLVASYFVGCMITNLITGGQFMSRFWVFTDWLAWGALFAASLTLVQWLPTFFEETEPVAPVQSPENTRCFTLGRLWMGAAIGCFGVLLVAGLGMAVKTPVPMPQHTAQAAEKAAEWWKTQPDAAGQPAGVVRPVQLGVSRAWLRKNEEVSDFNGLFHRRNFSRTVAFVQGERTEASRQRTGGLSVEFPLKNVMNLPRDAWWVLVGNIHRTVDTKLGFKTPVVRAAALVPMNLAGELDFSKAVLFPMKKREQ